MKNMTPINPKFWDSPYAPYIGANMPEQWIASRISGIYGLKGMALVHPNTPNSRAVLVLVCMGDAIIYDIKRKKFKNIIMGDNKFYISRCVNKHMTGIKMKDIEKYMDNPDQWVVADLMSPWNWPISDRSLSILMRRKS